MEGFVTKRGSIVHNWKVRWLCLHEDTVANCLELRYYKDRNKSKMKGKYVLESTSFVQPCENMNNQKNLIMINNSANSSFIFSAESQAVRDDWLNYLKAAIETVQCSAAQKTAPTVTKTPAVKDIHKSNMATSTINTVPNSSSTRPESSGATTTASTTATASSSAQGGADSSAAVNARARNATARNLAPGGAGSKQPARIAARLNTKQSDASKVISTGDTQTKMTATESQPAVPTESSSSTAADSATTTNRSRPANSDSMGNTTSRDSNRSSSGSADAQKSVASQQKHRSAPSSTTTSTCSDPYSPSTASQNLSADAAAAVAAIRKRDKLAHGCRPSEIGESVPANESDSDSDNNSASGTAADLADGWVEVRQHNH